MSTSLGGINVSFGLDLDKFRKGVENLQKTVKALPNTLRGIKLDAAIKGNPFKKVDEYIDKSRDLTKDVFTEWKKGIKSVDGEFNKFAENSRRNAERLTASFQRIGRQKATVLPEPVSACPTTSLPLIISGIHLSWMRVSSSNPCSIVFSIICLLILSS